MKRTLRIYLGIILKGWRYTLPVVAAVTIGSTLIFYVPPLIVASLINEPSNVTLADAWPMVFWFGLAWLVGEMMWRLAIHLMIKFETATIADRYKEAMKILMEKELSFYSNRFTGTITKNLLSYVRRFEPFFDTIIFEVISQLLPAVFGAVVLYFISPWLALALVLMLVASALLVTPLIKRRMKLVRVREDAHSALAGHISDVVTNVAAIKAFGSEKAEKAAHKRYMYDFLEKAKRSWYYQNNRVDMLVSPMYVATNVVGLAIVLSLDVDAATKASLFIAYSYYANITRFMWSFNNVYRRLEESITEASLFVMYMQKTPEIMDVQGATKLDVRNGAIKFNDIAFTHDRKQNVLFENFSLDIKPGQKIGLVGHSGAGKSTIVNLLLRFMNLDGGSIEIDGQNISKATQESLHKSIAFVPQEPLLFHRSLRENIAYGKPEASDDEILEAARKAHALEFIEKLPAGLDTLVGERGVKLSGGQRQRIAIARAILKDAPILVLDEATSALDSESEKLIQASLKDLMKNRTSVVIAHRLSTISKLDRIIVMENGRIVEDGSHDELVKHDGTYAKLWRHQSGGFIE